MTEVQIVYASHDELGEGPLWHAQEKALYWVDIENRLYHRLEPSSGAHQVVEVGEKLGVLAFCEGGGLVIASERGFSFFDPTERTLTPIGDPEADKPQTQFNDGAVDRAGRFWAGNLAIPSTTASTASTPTAPFTRWTPELISPMASAGARITAPCTWSTPPPR